MDFGFTLPNLQHFDITFNYFTGAIPPSIKNASKLERFVVAENKLTREMPHLQNLQRLSWFVITTKNLGSAGRDDLNFLCSLTNANRLEVLQVNDKNFEGFIRMH